MLKHRNPRKRLSKPASPSNRPALPEPPPVDILDGLMYALRDDLRRADAMVTTAERQIEENWHDDDEEDEEEDRKMRHRMRIEYLVEAGKYAVRGALYTIEQIDAELLRRRGA